MINNPFDFIYDPRDDGDHEFELEQLFGSRVYDYPNQYYYEAVYLEFDRRLAEKLYDDGKIKDL